MAEHPPTDEQQRAVTMFTAGDDMVIEAGAGTGKTSTLVHIADSTDARGQYVAFNKAIVVEAQGRLPSKCAANTAHSLAFRAVGHRYAGRLNSPRVAPWVLAERFDVPSLVVRVGEEARPLASQFLAGVAQRTITRFANTADAFPETALHMRYIEGIDLPDDDGRRTYANNDRVAEALQPVVEAMWVDVQRVEGGDMRFTHDHYLKLWQLSDAPRIECDYLLFDEAQDADPVMADVVARQRCQVVAVGDSQQAIYEWRGAVNALARFDADQRCFLTRSFRFGPQIADVANTMLARLRSPLRLVGAGVQGVVGPVEAPDAILCRTNARAVAACLAERAAGRAPHLVGGGREVVAFARAAQQLQSTGSTSHPELACFTSWGQVVEYVEQDQSGADLSLLVDLVERFTVPVILDALDNMTREDVADVVVSTAHKAKGREWGSVVLANDFRTKNLDDAERRLLYVAVTRAQQALDVSAVASLFPQVQAGAA